MVAERPGPADHLKGQKLQFRRTGPSTLLNIGLLAAVATVLLFKEPIQDLRTRYDQYTCEQAAKTTSSDVAKDSK
jgi:hypothetical protein